MQVHDLLTLGDSAPTSADVIIVGSGPAAWTLASELTPGAARILVLESGGGREGPETSELNETEDVGMPLFNGRCRVFGGTTASTGWGNRCIAFDPIDYERRDWVPESGWPFGPEEIAPYLDKAAQHLGAGSHVVEPDSPSIRRTMTKPPVDERLLRNLYWVFGRDRDWSSTRFSARFRDSRSDNVRVVLHATVTQLNVDPVTRRIASVDVAYPSGKVITISAPTVILCAGGIENPRLLLDSTAIAERGLGNDHDLVGRFLMDHPRDLDMAVTFDPRDTARLNKLFGSFRFDTGDGERVFSAGFALSKRVQRDEGLLNCAAWPMEDQSADDPIEALARIARRDRSQLRSDLRRSASRPDYFARALHSRLVLRQPVRRLPAKVGLLIGSEQTPDPQSRVELSDRVTRFGSRIARTDWRISRQDRASQGRLAMLIAQEFDRLRLPKPRLAQWILDQAYDNTVLQDGCHPTGTTRMASSPRHGVVDANCQVHGVGGLYVAGSSVFPTASHANPTLMIVAMACRLAAHLRTRIQGTKSMPEANAADAAAAQAHEPKIRAGTRVAVTGATGFIGGRLVERLLEQGAVVTCLSRSPANGRLQRPGVTTEQVDLSDADRMREVLRGIEVVFHCAYDWNDEDWNMRALRSLIAASRANGCARFVHISSFVVYELPSNGEVTEQTEDTTAGEGYSFVKRQMELELLGAHQADGFPCVILQPTIVYGPGSNPWTVEPVDMLRYGTVILPDQGEGVCAAVYVDDVVDAMLVAATNPAAVGERFLVSGPEPVTWGAFYETLAKAAGVRAPTYMPMASIERENTRLAKLRRFALSPERIIRRTAQVGVVRRALTAVLGLLPGALGRGPKDALYGPSSRRRGFVHMPDVGRARWMSGQSTIHSGKARQQMGYRPRFDLERGMAHTSAALKGSKADG